MSDLKSLIALQARLYEFLEQQDDTTLQGIINRTVQLTVLPISDAQAPVGSSVREEGHVGSLPMSAGLPVTPSSDPYQVAKDLAKLPTVTERRIFLNACGLKVDHLKKVAAMLGLKGYSGLRKGDLVDLLAGHAVSQPATSAPTPGRAEPPSPVPVEEVSKEGRHAPTEHTRSAPPERSGTTASPRGDAAAIALRLREIETEEEGAEYLRAQRLDRESLLAVAAELQLTRVDRLRQSELEKRVLRQAIGARRKFAGLRKW